MDGKHYLEGIHIEMVICTAYKCAYINTFCKKVYNMRYDNI